MLVSRIPALSLCGLMALSACSGDELTRNFGLVRDAPDEFRVTTRAPLSMPPDLSALPAPQPGTSRPQELTQEQAAQAVLSPDSVLEQAKVQSSPGQQALVAAAGPAAPKDIRARVDSESQLDRADRSFTDRLMFWKSSPPAGTVVDARRESQRLRQDAALGESPQTGDTPIIQRKKQGLFGSIF